MSYKITKAVLHNDLFVMNVKSFGKTIVADEYVPKALTKTALSLEDGFLKLTIGTHIELIPLANVNNISVVTDKT